MYSLIFHLTNMSNQKIIDMLESLNSKVDKNFGEIGGQLVNHSEAMNKMEKELTSRVQANTIELNATTQLAASNSAKVDENKTEIEALKNENHGLKTDMAALKDENLDLKKSFKKVEASQLDTLRRSYKE